MPKVMPKFIFMGDVALFALRRLVVVRIDGGESLLAEALSVALCQEQQGNGCKAMALSSSVGVALPFAKGTSTICTPSIHTKRRVSAVSVPFKLSLFVHDFQLHRASFGSLILTLSRIGTMGPIQELLLCNQLCSAEFNLHPDYFPVTPAFQNTNPVASQFFLNKPPESPL